MVTEKVSDGISKLKKCFIITPIGGDNTDIRRHAEGVIDAVISPILNEFDYDIDVAHRISKNGSINKQVITCIYDADLIIANLTGLNANVMYELAFAHSICKPTIIIAENEYTKLPFDISTERTIFYENDLYGAIELKENLINRINVLEADKLDNKIFDNPIHTWLGSSIYEKP